MCGISFILNKNSQEIDLSKSIDLMNNRIIHRGPNASGTYIYKNVALGHRRLSIIDLSEGANQPLFFNQYVLVFNGEIYNYKELREELSEYGYEFKTNTDSEVIPAAYDKWGEDCLNKFNGMWSFVLLDTKNDTIFFSRDRFGIKPLYIYEDNQSILMCSEIKQLLDIPWFKKEINTKTLNAFLNKEYNTSEDTFFKNVFEVRAGKKGSINLTNNSVSINRWYDLSKKLEKLDNSQLSYDEIVNKTQELFIDSLKLRLRSDVKVGSCLSGGIDSSSIVSMIKVNNLINEEFTTITSTYNKKNFDETYYSDLLCKQYKIKNLKVYPDLKKLHTDKLLQHINYYQDQPIPGCSHINEYEVFKKANEEGIIVMLDGQGADEYFLGYKEFESQLIFDLISQKKFLKTFTLIKEFSNQKKSSFWRELKILKNIYKKNKASKNKYGVDFRKTCSILSLEELLITSIPYQLHSEDRNSMLNSIESRLPFLDYRLVEFISSIAPEKRINNGLKKSIIRDAAYSLPEEIKNRIDKLGFVAPDKIFLEELGDDYEKIIKNLSKMNIIEPQYLTNLKTDKQKFRLVSVHEWLKAFNFIE